MYLCMYMLLWYFVSPLVWPAVHTSHSVTVCLNECGMLKGKWNEREKIKRRGEGWNEGGGVERGRMRGGEREEGWSEGRE